MLTTDKPIPTHGMTNISDLSRMKGKPENIQINPLPFNPGANQTSPSKQSLGMRTVIGPDGQMRVQVQPAPSNKPAILRKAPLKPVQSNAPEEAIVLDDDDD